MAPLVKDWGLPFTSQHTHTHTHTHTHSKSLLILRVNNTTMWAVELLLLTIAKACWVKSHRSCVFLLRSCIEFKQEQHSCGNTLLHLWRTPRERLLSSSGVTTHQLALSFPCLSHSQVWKYQPRLLHHLHVSHDKTMPSDNVKNT